MTRAPLCERVNETIDVFDVPSCRTHSEFDEQISLFKGHVEQARDNLLEIEDCIKALKKELADGLKAIERYNDDIAGYKTQVIKETFTVEPDQERLDDLKGKIVGLEADIAAVAGKMAKCLESIVGCEKLRQPWRDARDDRKRIHFMLKREDRKGRRGGVPLTCNAVKPDGTRCRNPKQYIDGKWVACEDHY